MKLQIVFGCRSVAATAFRDFKLIQAGRNVWPRFITEELDLDLGFTPGRGDWCELPSGKEAFDQSRQSGVGARQSLDKKKPTGDRIKASGRRSVKDLNTYHATGISVLLIRGSTRRCLKERGCFQDIHRNGNRWFYKWALTIVMLLAAAFVIHASVFIVDNLVLLYQG